MEIGVLIVCIFVVAFLVLLGIVHLCKSAGCLSKGVPVVLDKVTIEEVSSVDDDVTTSDGYLEEVEEGVGSSSHYIGGGF